MNGLCHALNSFVLSACIGAAAFAQDATIDQAEAGRFFEAQIRPILVERCQECHGPETQESGLRLDSREALLKGNDAGPVVTPDNAAASRLIQAIRYDGKIQMPPDEKLSDAQIAAIEQWLALGAPWPEAAHAETKPLTALDRIAPALAGHWSLQPLAMPAIPPVSDPSWPANEVDHFVMARLDAAGIKPSAPADRRTWLRRVTYDLTGLPLTADEASAFESDGSPDAFEKVVERLLASLRYGERWGRHWLDVARYADTKGYVFAEDRRFPFSYTYRDYVIRAFNEDLPYERFITEQLAADQLDLGDDKRPLAAMGFLTIGRRFSNNMHDIIDDRIDVVCRGLMALTVGCARCHDHKYDPIASTDYYALYGVFASCNEPDEKPLIVQPDEGEKYREFEAELSKRRQEANVYLREKSTELKTRLRGQSTAYLLAVASDEMEDLPDIFDVSIGADDLNPKVVDRWRKYLERTAQADHPVFGPWKRLADHAQDGFADCAATLYDELSAGQLDGVNALVRQALVEKRPASMFELAQLYGELLVQADKQFETLRAERPAAESLDDRAAEELRQVLYADRSPTAFDDQTAVRLFQRDVSEHYSKLRTNVEEWEVTSSEAPARAMVLVDNSTPYRPHVFARGNPNRPEQEVPRRFPCLLDGGVERPFSTGSGRRELAERIVAHDNPLAYRVWMNRVWLHHFGMSLVRDPSDFGLRSDPPTHPELLDYLAARFIADGQSLKRMHRLIVLSNTYRQQSVETSPGRDVDPENRLYWRMNPRRLEFEAYRDALLTAAGRLDSTLGGRPVNLENEPFSTRRTVYGYVDRQVLPELFRTFDFASPDASTALRPQTTVPQQALYAMNSPFAIEQARQLVARGDIAAQSAPADRVRALYRAVLAREASDDEVQLGCQFVESCGAADGQPLTAWEQYAQALMMSNEFAYVD